jgi:hypothetical protein
MGVSCSEDDDPDRPALTCTERTMNKRLAVLALLILLCFAPGCDLFEGEDFNCGDFDSQAEAQAFYVDEGGPIDDPHSLDLDRDGQACEDEF